MNTFKTLSFVFLFLIGTMIILIGSFGILEHFDGNDDSNYKRVNCYDNNGNKILGQVCIDKSIKIDDTDELLKVSIIMLIIGSVCILMALLLSIYDGRGTRE